MSERPLPVVVLGATATGKTGLAVALGQELGGEVVSADASCVYRGLDIGTAKPTQAQRRAVPHHLIDVCAPDEEFTAARFAAMARAAIREIEGRRHRPILVGGTGLYLRALLRGLVSSPPPDERLRRRLEARERARPGSLHRILRRLDPPTAAETPTQNVVRLVRALEHRLCAGRPISEARGQWAAPDSLPSVKIGLRLARPERERRIRRRIDEMLEDGLEDEVRRLLHSGVPPTARAFRALGYREMIEHVAGRLSLAEVRERMVVRTRRYAKRQDTWFRKERDVTWLPAAADAAELKGLVRRAMMAIQDRGPR